MKRTVSAMVARGKFGELLESVLYRGDEVVIERAGKAMGVLISPTKYLLLEQNRERMYRALADNAPPAPVAYEEAERIAVEAVRDLRKKGTRSRRRSA